MPGAAYTKRRVPSKPRAPQSRSAPIAASGYAANIRGHAATCRGSAPLRRSLPRALFRFHPTAPRVPSAPSRFRATAPIATSRPLSVPPTAPIATSQPLSVPSHCADRYLPASFGSVSLRRSLPSSLFRFRPTARSRGHFQFLVPGEPQIPVDYPFGYSYGTADPYRPPFRLLVLNRRSLSTTLSATRVNHELKTTSFARFRAEHTVREATAPDRVAAGASPAQPQHEATDAGGAMTEASMDWPPLV